ncbi:MAG: hypothetical protein IJC99_04225 [Clostridia bacterium]|nr:hypothetical protein [Clostridia bacterium]
MKNVNMRLARINRASSESAWQRLRGRLVVEKIRKKRSESEELAVLRKAVACLFEVVAKLHAGEIANEEFLAYHAEVERIKAEVDTYMEGTE